MKNPTRTQREGAAVMLMPCRSTLNANRAGRWLAIRFHKVSTTTTDDSKTPDDTLSNRALNAHGQSEIESPSVVAA